MTNLLIPAALTPTLQIPDLTVTTGEPDGVWCTRSWGVLRGSRRHVIQLPYDGAAAAKLRKLAVLDRIHLLPLGLYLLCGVWVWLSPPHKTLWPFALNGVMVVWGVLGDRWRVNPTPVRTGRGDLYLPDLPPAVAQLWIEINPGVQAVDRKPIYRRWPPRVYATGAVVCVAAAVALMGWVATGADIPLSVLFVIPALIIGALTLVYRALPTGHTRLNGHGTIP